jgi:hypothetical protein
MINPEEYGDKRRNGTSTGQIRSIWTYLDKEEKDMVDTPSNLKKLRAAYMCVCVCVCDDLRGYSFGTPLKFKLNVLTFIFS